MAETVLSPDEQRFFETGELPPVLQQQHAAAAAPIDPLALAAVGGGLEATQAAAPHQTATQTEQATQAATQQAVAQQATQQTDAVEVLRRSLAEAQQRVGQLEQYLQQTTQQQTIQQQVQAPDPETDPLGNMMHQIAEVNKTVLALQNQLAQQNSQQQNAANFQSLQQQVQSLKNEFAKTAPDFNDAYSHLRESRIADLRLLGVSETNIQRAIFSEETALAESAIRQGRNPAEVVYEMAKRHGYQAKVLPTTAAATPDAKLAAIQQAQAAAKNLPKSINAEDFTVAGLKDLSEADLNKAVMDPAIWAKIAGKDSYPL